MTLTPGNEPQASVDLAAVAADDALLESLAAGGASAALTWDGTIDEPSEITDALIWTDEPVQRPAGTPVKKSRGASGDQAASVLALVLGDAEIGLAAAMAKMTIPAAVVVAPQPSPTWSRLARRTGTRGAAALAAVAVSLGGVAAASVAAGPSSPLYPVHKLFAGANPVSEQAYAVARVRAALDEAKAALDNSQPGLAHGKLSVAEARLQSVTAGADKDALIARYDELTALVAAAGHESSAPTTQTPSGPPPVTPSSGVSPTQTPTQLPSDPETGKPSDKPTKPAKPGDGKIGGGKDGNHSHVSTHGRTADGSDDGSKGGSKKPAPSADAAHQHTGDSTATERTPRPRPTMSISAAPKPAAKHTPKPKTGQDN